MSDEETTDVKTAYEDTPEGAGDSAGQGVGVSPLPVDPEHFDDPKSGGTPVHPSPTDETQTDEVADEKDDSGDSDDSGDDS